MGPKGFANPWNLLYQLLNTLSIEFEIAADFAWYFLNTKVVTFAFGKLFFLVHRYSVLLLRITTIARCFGS